MPKWKSGHVVARLSFAKKYFNILNCYFYLKLNIKLSWTDGKFSKVDMHSKLKHNRFTYFIEYIVKGRLKILVSPRFIINNGQSRNLWCNMARKWSTNNNLLSSVPTYQLLKKSAVYRLSKSEMMLNNGGNIVNTWYKIFGKGFTNSIIESTAGDVFTAGPNIKTLIKNTDEFYTNKGILSAANYVLEGWENDDVVMFNNSRNYLLETLDRVWRTRPYSHLSVKLTGLWHMDMLIQLNKAQHALLYGLFYAYSSKPNDGRRVLTKEGIVKFLTDNGYSFTENSLNEFIEISKFKDSEYGSDEIGEVEYYANVHAHYFKSDKHKTDIIGQIWEKSGVTTEIRESIYRFEERVESIISRVSEYGSFVFLDAEQTYIQVALDSLIRQLQSYYHKKQKSIYFKWISMLLKICSRACKTRDRKM